MSFSKIAFICLALVAKCAADEAKDQAQTQLAEEHETAHGSRMYSVPQPSSGPTPFQLPQTHAGLNKYQRQVLPTQYVPASFQVHPSQFQRVEIPHVKSQTTRETRPTDVQPMHQKANPAVQARPVYGKAHHGSRMIEQQSQQDQIQTATQTQAEQTEDQAKQSEMEEAEQQAEQSQSQDQANVQEPAKAQSENEMETQVVPRSIEQPLGHSQAHEPGHSQSGEGSHTQHPSSGPTPARHYAIHPIHPGHPQQHPLQQ